MSLILDGSNGVTFPNSTVQASAGQVLQVVNGTYSTQTSNATTTYADTGLTASITPKFSTSKILVLVNHCQVEKSSGDSNNGVYLGLFRNSTEISTLTGFLGYTGTTLRNVVGSASVSYLDSPATTSSTTYKTQFKNFNASSNVTVQSGGTIATITLMEIAA